ncbi:MAG: thiol-disulfide oxidoreductase-associated membrane protein CcdA2 [Coprobacillus sp.]
MYHEIFFGTVFIAGVLSFFSPCIFPLLPIYIGTLLDDEGKDVIKIKNITIHTTAIIKTLVFILGISTVFFILGYGAGALSGILYSPYTNYIMGIIVIILGLHQMDIINVKILQRRKAITFQQNKHKGLIQAFLLGLTFSFGWTPCIGPVLSSILAVAASNDGTALYGGFLMLVYAFGLAIPFLLMALASTFVMNCFQKLKKHIVLMKRIGGILIIIMGVLLMFDQLNYLTTLF